MDAKRIYLEADSKIRPNKRMALDAKIVGPILPRMFMTLSKQAAKVSLSRKHNDVSSSMDTMSCPVTASTGSWFSLDSSRTQFS